MIDLHCHLLPQIDDGSKSLEESLAMARMAVADGITITACTPHILPGLYNNNGPKIRAAIAELQLELDKAQIPLMLSVGADVHITVDVVDGLKSGRNLSLGDSRYFLLEPPHHIAPPRFTEYVFGIVSAGFVPVITHPERLSWVDSHYTLIEQAVRIGALMQLTGGSLLGHFGSRARKMAGKLLREGLIHVVASDAHDTEKRPPTLKAAFEAAATIVGHNEALNLFVTRPAGILKNLEPLNIPAARPNCARKAEGFWSR